MRNLIIIGNGFDLAHGLDTDYKSFIADIEKDINTDQKKYGLKGLIDNYFLRKLMNKKLTDSNWCDIECSYFNLLEESIEYKPGEINTDVTGLNKGFQQVKEFLAKYLHEQEQNFDTNKNYEKFFDFFESKGDTVVLNFNYTNTVKAYTDKYPKIELIHIHGELDDDKESEANPMIFGYAADDDESKNLLNNNDNQYVRNIKRFNYRFTSNEGRLKKFLKDCSSDEATPTFNVLILGHSCGLSDKLILNQIFNSKNIYKIYPFYYAGDSVSEARDNYLNMTANMERIIDDYLKPNRAKKASEKIIAFPDCIKIPQTIKNESFEVFFEKYKQGKLTPSNVYKGAVFP